ncbi:MAG TPA: phospho-N-acetylmuramoyl-pentapeptide-transferase [Tepidisphaeraceae bacterium]|jgi:phospho-N-acetylmuramoyl-pentapeptide-transferase|nr:phospho-N-acetylmuramoyl-pentapeptide-transferase [Tepidisphaeraceae bacterium]
MLYLFAEYFKDWINGHHGFGFLRVFGFVTFQATAAIVLAFFLCVLLGPRVIAWLRHQKIGDNPNFDQAEIDKLMAGKRGVPTMGGLLIIFSIVATVLLLGNLRNFYVEMGLLCLIWLGCVGAIDDWLKLTVGRRSGSRQGLSSKEKLLFQIGLGVLLAYFTWNYGSGGKQQPEHFLMFPFFQRARLPLNLGIFILIATIVMTGTSNAVNLTDGLDGLAAGCMAISSFTFFILAMIIGNKDWATTLHLPYVQAADQMAVLAGAMAGACIGFLWFNCSPASVFMGDTGSLAMGGLLGYIAIVVRQELLLILIGGIFVVEALSVMLQVSYFKYTRIFHGEGKRIFLMSPLHHHFQRKGWTETQVVVRFWLISALLAAMAVATVKLR